MKKSLLVFALIFSVLLLTACGSKSTTPAVTSVVSQPETIIAEGQLLPENRMDLVFETPGQVTEVLVKNGDLVDAGQVLARLADSPEAQAALGRAQQEEISARLALEEYKASADLHLADAQLALIAAQNELENAQSRYDSNDSDENKARLDAANNTLLLAKAALEKLEGNDGLDPDLLAAAEARYSAAQASVAVAQKAVDGIELKSTIAGTIANVNLQVGQWVTAYAPVMSVADLSKWIIKTNNLTELDVIDITVGQKVTVILDALPELVLDGEVSQINPQFEEKRGDITYTVTILLTQTDPLMHWGMTGAVEFIP